MRYAQTNLELYKQLKDRSVSEEDLTRVADAYGLAIRLFSNRFRACGRPFVTHLIGTSSVIAHHGGDIDSILAALLHAAYDQGEYGDHESGASQGHRDTLRRNVGEKVESLIDTYEKTTWPPEDLTAIADRISADNVEDAEYLVLMLGIANEYDDCRDLAPLYYGEAKQRIVLHGLASSTLIAEALGEITLAGELMALQREIDQAEITDPLSKNRNGSYTVESVQLRERVLRVCRRKLLGRGRTR